MRSNRKNGRGALSLVPQHTWSSSFYFQDVAVVQSLSHVWLSWPHELLHTRLPCLSLFPRVCSESCPLRRWCHPTFSYSVARFSSCPRSFPASGSFPVNWLFASGRQTVGASTSASASVLPMNIQDWFPLGLTGLVSLQSNGLSESSPAPEFESINSLPLSLLYGPTLTSIHDSGKTIALTIWTFVGKVKSLLFNSLSRFVIAFLLRSNCLLILWLQSLSTVILEPKKRKSVTASTFPPSIYHEVMGLDAIILIFWMLSFKPAFHSPLSQSSRSSLVPLHFLPLEWYHLHNWGCWNFSQKSWF